MPTGTSEALRRGRADRVRTSHAEEEEEAPQGNTGQVQPRHLWPSLYQLMDKHGPHERGQGQLCLPWGLCRQCTADSPRDPIPAPNREGGSRSLQAAGHVS